MKRSSGLWEAFAASLALVASGCATPATFGAAVSLRPADDVAAPAGGAVAHAVRVGGPGRERIVDAHCAPDGSVTLFGETQGSFGPSADLLAVHVPQGRGAAWAKTLGGPGEERIDRVRPMPDGGFLLVGTTRSPFQGPAAQPAAPGERPARPLLVKLSAAGEPEWVVRAEASGERAIAQLSDAAATSDGGYLLAGAAADGPEQRNLAIAVVKLDEDGMPVWGRRYAFDDPGRAEAVAVMPDGDVVVAATLERPQGGGAQRGVGLLRLSRTGFLEWARQAWAGGHSVTPRRVVATGDGFALAGGIEGGFGAGIVAIRFAGDGALVWAQRYADPGTGRATAVALDATGAGDLVIGGSSGVPADRERKAGAPAQRGARAAILIVGPGGEPKVSTTLGGAGDEEVRSIEAWEGGRICAALAHEEPGASADAVTAVWTIPQGAGGAPLLEAAPVEVRTYPVEAQSEPLPYVHEPLAVAELTQRSLEASAPLAPPAVAAAPSPAAAPGTASAPAVR